MDHRTGTREYVRCMYHRLRPDRPEGCHIPPRGRVDIPRFRGTRSPGFCSADVQAPKTLNEALEDDQDLAFYTHSFWHGLGSDPHVVHSMLRWLSGARCSSCSMQQQRPLPPRFARALITSTAIQRGCYVACRATSDYGLGLPDAEQRTTRPQGLAHTRIHTHKTR
jgi:hypothetical protein